MRRGSADIPNGADDTARPAARDGAGQPVSVAGCFGWLHPAAPGSGIQGAGDPVAVLLCPALGWDGLHSHHGFRVLAEAFAAAGYAALRLHYPGTGNSADLPDDGSVNQWKAWQGCVHDAADWLRSATGAHRLLLVGLRFGATLALAAAGRRADLAGLLLLAPVLRGKSYMRQLDMEARLEGGSGLGEAADGLALHELRFSAATVAEIGALDMRHAALPAGIAVALAAQAPSQVVDRCVQAWTGAGVAVRELPFTGLEPLLQEAIHSDPPAPDVSQVLEWARLAVPSGGSAGGGSVVQPWPVFRHGACAETPLRFGADGSLFGVLCQPQAGPGHHAVIIANTGRDPHYGIGRFGVQLARRLAAAGIASLRMDFAGLGDSPWPERGNRLSALFETDRTGDLAAAIDRLQGLGFRTFAVQGLCSGAYHALRAAQHDARIGTLLLVNLPVFDWQGGDSVRTATLDHRPGQPPAGASWPIGRRGGARCVARRMCARFCWRSAAAAAPVAGQWLAALAARGSPAGAAAGPVRSGAGDGHAGAAAAALAVPVLRGRPRPGGGGGRRSDRRASGVHACPGASVRVVEGIDHVLSGRRMRETVVNLMLAFLAEDWARECHAMTIRSTILDQMTTVARLQQQTLAPLHDDLTLLESGLDSLALAILVANLEDELELDPFGAGRDGGDAQARSASSSRCTRMRQPERQSLRALTLAPGTSGPLRRRRSAARSAGRTVSRQCDPGRRACAAWPVGAGPHAGAAGQRARDARAGRRRGPHAAVPARPTAGAPAGHRGGGGGDGRGGGQRRSRAGLRRPPRAGLPSVVAVPPRPAPARGRRSGRSGCCSPPAPRDGRSWSATAWTVLTGHLTAAPALARRDRVEHVLRRAPLWRAVDPGARSARPGRDGAVQCGRAGRRRPAARCRRRGDAHVGHTLALAPRPDEPGPAALSPRTVRMSGEIADQAILDRVKAAFPAAQVTHAFASTEAGSRSR